MKGGNVGKNDACVSTDACACPLSGVNRTPWVQCGIDANDPDETSGLLFPRSDAGFSFAVGNRLSASKCMIEGRQSQVALVTPARH